MLDKLIQDMKERGLIAISPIKLKGKAGSVIGFINLMADTDLYCPDSRELMYIAEKAVCDGGSLK